MNKFLTLFVLFIFSGACLEAQIYRDSIQGVSDFNLDPLGNCYFLKGSDIVKLNARGSELVRYSMKNIGKPSSFDVNNPMRILIFYAEFAVIRILDNNLVEQSEVNLRELGIMQPRVMAGTPDQGIWVYDEISGSLIKIDQALKRSAISVDLNQLTGKRPNPHLLLANQHWLVLQDENTLFVLDQFGTKVKTLALTEKPSLLQLKENELIFSSDKKLITMLLTMNAEKTDVCNCPAVATKCILNGDKYWYIVNQTLVLPE